MACDTTPCTKSNTKRLTNHWTQTLDEAFGENGTKGRLGEEFLARVFDRWGWEWKLNGDDRTSQINGRDIEFRSPRWRNFYSAEVKNNLTDAGVFYVYEYWLFKIRCDRVFHVNPNTCWIVYYDVEQMRKTYDGNLQRMVFGPRTKLSFMKSRKVVV